MRGADGTPRLVAEQHRHAVGHHHHADGARHVGDARVGAHRRRVGSAGQHRIGTHDRGGMYLLEPRRARPTRQRQQPGAIDDHGLRIVPGAKPEVESARGIAVVFGRQLH